MPAWGAPGCCRPSPPARGAWHPPGQQPRAHRCCRRARRRAGQQAERAGGGVGPTRCALGGAALACKAHRHATPRQGQPARPLPLAHTLPGQAGPGARLLRRRPNHSPHGAAVLHVDARPRRLAQLLDVAAARPDHAAQHGGQHAHHAKLGPARVAALRPGGRVCGVGWGSMWCGAWCVVCGVRCLVRVC